MRLLASVSCSARLSGVLAARQSKVDDGSLAVDAAWKSFSKLKSYDELRTVLAEPLGVRRRCAYCSDSRAADVEHYWPKSNYPAFAFQYLNLLLVCPECNRKKNSTFPLDSSGHPLLINPILDDPWDMLFFVPQTGIIDARAIGASPDGTLEKAPRGIKTLEVLGDILNSTSVIEGRKENWEEMGDIFEDWMRSDDDPPRSQADLFGIKDIYGLGEFMLNREGKEQTRLRALRLDYPARWSLVRNLPRQ